VLYMRRFRKQSENVTNHAKDAPAVKEVNKAEFDMDFRQFTGQTVTVFVNAGGEVGKGFTGVLTGSTPTYIKLLMLPAMPPACPLGNACSSYGNILFCGLCPFNKKASVGSVAIIPVSNITAFVHNTLSSNSSFDM
jgi:hypothetical protein